MRKKITWCLLGTQRASRNCVRHIAARHEETPHRLSARPGSWSGLSRSNERRCVGEGKREESGTKGSRVGHTQRQQWGRECSGRARLRNSRAAPVAPPHVSGRTPLCRTETGRLQRQAHGRAVHRGPQTRTAPRHGDTRGSEVGGWEAVTRRELVAVRHQTAVESP